MRVCGRFFAVALVLIVIGFLLGISFPAIGAEQGKTTDKPIIIFKPLKSPIKSTPVEPTEAKPSAVKSTPVPRSAAKRSVAKFTPVVEPSAAKSTEAKPSAATPAPAKPSAVNCKYTTKMDKSGQVIYMPTGGECERLLKDFTLQSKSCCVCAKESSDPAIMCKGACCPGMLDKVDIKR